MPQEIMGNQNQHKECDYNQINQADPSPQKFEGGILNHGIF